VVKDKPGYKLVLSNFRKYEEIPIDWDLKKIDEIGKVIGGGTPKTDNEEYWNGNIIWATPSDLSENKGNFFEKTERTITKKD